MRRLAQSAALAAWTASATAPAHANVPVVVSPGEQSEPVMASDGGGGTIIVWQDFRGGAESDIYAQRIGADGTPQWTAGGVTVCGAAAFQALPRIVTDGEGGAIVAWTDYRNGNGDIYGQRLNAAGTPLWAPDGLPICDDGQPQLGVEIAADGSGGIIATWEDYRSGPEGDLYAQRVGAAGTPSWSLNGVVVCAAPGTQTSPSICDGGGANAIVLWRDQRSSGTGDLYAQRLSPSGVRQWDADGALVCGAAGGQYDPIAVADGAGGLIAVWSDERAAWLADIYAQRLDSAGAPQWDADGALVCGAPSYQLFPVAAADGAGGALIAWEDSRSDTSVDVYAQRIGPDGAPLWTADGVRLSNADGYDSLPSICADGGGGAIVTWQDQRDLDDDIYAQRVSGGGILMWFAAGIPVSLAPGTQLAPALVSDGYGGALVAWYDARNGDWDIYAQHADAWGNTGDPVSIDPAPVHAGLQLAAPVPNPACGPVMVRFCISESATVELAVFDAAGRRVRTLLSGPVPAGAHTLAFDVKDGGALRPGLYFVRLGALGRTAVTRLVALP
jgi:hypothetical protein